MRPGRKTLKHLSVEKSEIDYYQKLTEDEKDYLDQFLFEYYQADFNYDCPIHDKKYRKDCSDRNNASKRQWHSVGENLKLDSYRRAVNRKKRSQKNVPYTIDDYFLNADKTSYEEEENLDEKTDK